MPDVVSVHTNMALTNIAQAYPRTGLVAANVLADLTVPKKTDFYYIFDSTKRAWAAVDDRREAGATANEADFAMTSATYGCEGHALRRLVTDEEVANADAPIQPLSDCTEFLTSRVLMNMEIDCKAKLDAALTGAQTSNPTNEWDDKVNGDPVADIDLARQTVENGIGLSPNIMVMDSITFNDLRNHPAVLERVIYGGGPSTPAMVTTQTIAALFGFEEILVSTALKNTALEGQAASTSRVWADDVYVLYRPANAGMKVPALGYRFSWAPFNGSNFGWAVENYREVGRHGEWVEVSKYYDQRITLATAGYRLSDRKT